MGESIELQEPPPRYGQTADEYEQERNPPNYEQSTERTDQPDSGASDRLLEEQTQSETNAYVGCYEGIKLSYGFRDLDSLSREELLKNIQWARGCFRKAFYFGLLLGLALALSFPGQDFNGGPKDGGQGAQNATQNA